MPPLVPTRTNPQRFPCYRVRDIELLRLEKQAFDAKTFPKNPIVFTITVHRIANQRMAKSVEMASDLVHASRLGLGITKRIARSRVSFVRDRQFNAMNDLIVRDRLNGWVLWAVFWPKRSLDRSCIRRQPPAHNAYVTLRYPALAEIRIKAFSGILIESEQEHARSGAIKTMDRIKVAIQLLAQKKKAVLSARNADRPIFGRVNEKSSRLVDRNEPWVLKKDPKLHPRMLTLNEPFRQPSKRNTG